MKCIPTTLALLIVSASLQGACAQDSPSQADKDFEQKQRIYGTKHPWENTAPYGTQYTPPQAGIGNSNDSAAADTKAAEPSKSEKKKPSSKPKVKSKKSSTSTAPKKPGASAK
jgi:hypothetical protein